MGQHEQGRCLESIDPSKAGCARNQESERVDTRGREQHFCGHAPLESLKVMLSRCTTGKRRAPAEEKVLGLCDISRAHFHSPARRRIVIKVPREDDECTSGCAVLDKAMYGTKGAAQCFDVASESAMTAMGYDTGKFSPCLYHSSADAPTVGNLEALKRVARYLIGHGRLVQEFVRPVEEPSHAVVFTDSDHAGFLKTHENSSSSQLFYGSHMLRSTSTTQGVAMSLGESELRSGEGDVSRTWTSLNAQRFRR